MKTVEKEKPFGIYLLMKIRNWFWDQEKHVIFLSLGAVLLGFSACSDQEEISKEEIVEKEEGINGSIPGVVPPDVEVTRRATKIEQLVGDMDREREEPTRNTTYTRYGLQATDLGVPFQDGETTYILFGDTWGTRGGLPNVMAHTKDQNPEDGISLDFITDDEGIYHPLTVSQISQREFEVPTEGVMVNDEMYIYHTTDHSQQVTMGRSVLARSNGDGGKTFDYLYDFSIDKFINVSLVKIPSSDWAALPAVQSEEGLVLFGSGTYRESELFLAYQPAAEIEDPGSRRYFSGLDQQDRPLWKAGEKNALPLFNMDQPCIGEFSVSYNEFIEKWILLYNCGNPRGINLRTADDPWGPWSEPLIIFHPWEDEGYCHYIHVNHTNQQCDHVHDPGRENKWGGEYGPYQFEHFAFGDDAETTIYFTMSTWNPYTVVLMKASLANKK